MAVSQNIIRSYFIHLYYIITRNEQLELQLFYKYSQIIKMFKSLTH